MRFYSLLWRREITILSTIVRYSMFLHAGCQDTTVKDTSLTYKTHLVIVYFGVGSKNSTGMTSRFLQEEIFSDISLRFLPIIAAISANDDFDTTRG